MQKNEILKFLYSLENKGTNLGLERTEKLLQFLNNPHKKLKTIHVAGTNGKGSSTAFISSILIENGLKVGIYTSPHLINFNERIKINNQDISDLNLSLITKKLLPAIKKNNPTFFEVTTVIAFYYFFQNSVDIAVIETGLGGRLDATNVINPLVSLITKIDFDHTEILGNTLKKIAFEKSGIIKEDKPIVLATNNNIVFDVVNKFAKSKNSDLTLSKNEIVNEEIIPLKGSCQIENCKNAISVVKILNREYNYCISKNNISCGIKNVLVNTNFHARFETISKNPNIICDVAHNPNGIKSLITEIKNEKLKNIKFIFGVMKDKNYKLMLKELMHISDEIYFVEPKNQRTLKFNEIGFKSKKIIFLNGEIPKTIEHIFKNIKKTDNLIITGSHYVVGELLNYFKIKLDSKVNKS